METLKKIFSFYINSSIHVAIAISALVKITFLKLEIEEENSFLFFSFFGSISAYNFIKYSNVSKLYHKRLTGSMKGIRYLTILSSILFVYFAFLLPLRTVLVFLPFMILSILYAAPILPNKRNLRSFAGIKIFIIALVWTGVSVLMPAIHTEIGLHPDIIIEIIQRFLFVVVIMLPFEIRDLQYDDKELGTIPQMIGVTRAKVFGGVLLVIFLLLTAAKSELSSTEILSTVSITGISLLFLWGTEKKQSEYFCSFWVESIPVMWLITIVLLQELFK